MGYVSGDGEELERVSHKFGASESLQLAGG